MEKSQTGIKLLLGWLFGTDWEFSLSDERGRPVSAIGLIGGTKSEPLSIGNDCNRQEDNVAVEISQPPCTQFNEFLSYIDYSLIKIQGIIPENLSFNFDSVREFSDEELDNPQARAFGCESSYNVYIKGSGESISPTTNIRTFGLHIHFGLDELLIPDGHNLHNCEKLVRLFDKYVTLPSVLMDPEKSRREMYGRAGEFRFKPYGLECRQLGSYFLGNAERLKWMWEAVQTVAIQYEAGEDLTKDPLYTREGLLEDPCFIEEIINGYDLKAIANYCKENEIKWEKEEESSYMEA